MAEFEIQRLPVTYLDRFGKYGGNTGPRSLYPFRSMKVGECFFMTEQTFKKDKYFRQKMCSAGKKMKCRFAKAKAEKDGIKGYYVTRIS